MIEILMADDHAIVREGLKQIVGEEMDMRVAGEAANCNEVFEMLKQRHWDILVLDISMPGRSGLDALKDIKLAYPHLPVLILSIYTEEQYGVRALRYGASGFLPKASAPRELVTAIRKIVSGGRYINETLAEKLADFLENDNALPHEALSEREYQILCQIAGGMTADQIAEELCISVHTVYSYRNRVLDKMKLKSNVELTQYAIQNNLIKL